MGRIRRNLTYANVISTLSLFLVLGGGTALAAYVVGSNSQIGPGTVSGHKPPSGDHANIIAGSVNGQDVANSSLSGAKIVKFSGVDACTPTLLAKFGRICAGSDGVARSWSDALTHCSSFGLRLPSVSEAVTLATNYAVPGVNSGEFFWTDNDYLTSSGFRANTVRKDGQWFEASAFATNIKTVCVANPTN
jgi:hypothetical protein